MTIALKGLRVVDISGTISTEYCSKLFSDYGAEVINLEPSSGFKTRQIPPFFSGSKVSAMHAYLNTNKLSVLKENLTEVELLDLITEADLVLSNGEENKLLSACAGVVSDISWYGKGGDYENFVGTDAQCFALNGMLGGLGSVEGPPIIPSGYQAQVVGGMAAFVGSLGQVLGVELGNCKKPVQIETSIFEASLCFTEVGAVTFFNTGLEGKRLGVNRFPPTYPLGVFPCKEGWIGLTVLTPSQWHAFCKLLDMEYFARVPKYQTALGRLKDINTIEPVIKNQLLNFSAEELFYKGQEAAIPLARVPTMEELLEVDQFIERQAFTTAILPDKRNLKVPSVPFRLFKTPPSFGGYVADLGENTEVFNK
jgi:crotonobetainyl-CoA:carnitine CoA-transferase CaiB-like acyl-CoA transferase